MHINFYIMNNLMYIMFYFFANIDLFSLLIIWTFCGAAALTGFQIFGFPSGVIMLIQAGNTTYQVMIISSAFVLTLYQRRVLFLTQVRLEQMTREQYLILDNLPDGAMIHKLDIVR